MKFSSAIYRQVRVYRPNDTILYSVLSKYGSLPTDRSMYGFCRQKYARGCLNCLIVKVIVLIKESLIFWKKYMFVKLSFKQRQIFHVIHAWVKDYLKYLS